MLVEDSLFATLDPTTRRTETSDGRVYTMSDTVGFVRHLPHQLVEAFRSTLEEVAEADLIVHVVDGSHPDPEGQLAAVREVFAEIGADKVAELVVINKADLADPMTIARLRQREPHSVVVSAKTGEGIPAALAPSRPTCRTPTSTSRCCCPTTGATWSAGSTTRARCSRSPTPATAPRSTPGSARPSPASSPTSSADRHGRGHGLTGRVGRIRPSLSPRVDASGRRRDEIMHASRMTSGWPRVGLAAGMLRLGGRLIAVVVLCLWVFVPMLDLTPVDTDFVSEPTSITNYDADFTVDDDGDLRAVERVTVNFPQYEYRHGIFGSSTSATRTSRPRVGSRATSRCRWTAARSRSRSSPRSAAATTP